MGYWDLLWAQCDKKSFALCKKKINRRMTLQFYNEKVFILGSANRLPPLANTWSHSALKLGKCRIGDIFKLEKHVDFSF